MVRVACSAGKSLQDLQPALVPLLVLAKVMLFSQDTDWGKYHMPAILVPVIPLKITISNPSHALTGKEKRKMHPYRNALQLVWLVQKKVCIALTE